MSKPDDKPPLTFEPSTGEDIKRQFRSAEETIKNIPKIYLNAPLSIILRETNAKIKGNASAYPMRRQYQGFTSQFIDIFNNLNDTYEQYDYDLSFKEFKNRVKYYYVDAINILRLAHCAYEIVNNNKTSPSQLDIILNSYLEHKLELIRRFAEDEQNEEVVAKYISTLFPSLQFVGKSDQRESLNSSDTVYSTSSLPSTASLPRSAPASWKTDKLATETPPEFIKRVYGEWLGKGLDRPKIRHLDPALYQAIANWSRQNQWPTDVDLPTAKERNAREIAALGEQAPDGNVNSVLGNFTAREAQRIRSAMQRRRGVN